MRSVSILIPNFNGFDALKLCIESVQKYTRYPHKIIVHDDASTNDEDLNYLKDLVSKDLIDLIIGRPRRGHGHSLNILLNSRCKTDLAMIMDNDVQVLSHGWLERMVATIDDDTLLVSNVEENLTKYSWFQTWFMMLNMELYRHMFKVDWLPLKIEGELLPTGGRLWLKYLNENPDGYKIVPVPDDVSKQFYHFVHFSCYSTTHPTNEENIGARRKVQFKRAKIELEKLRAGK